MEKACPMCDFFNGPMGSLGSLIWYRCRSCGMEYNHQCQDDVACVKREGLTEPEAMYQDNAPVYDIDEACMLAEQSYGPDWEYVCTPDVTVNRVEWLSELKDVMDD